MSIDSVSITAANYARAVEHPIAPPPRAWLPCPLHSPAPCAPQVAVFLPASTEAKRIPRSTPAVEALRGFPGIGIFWAEGSISAWLESPPNSVGRSSGRNP